MSGIKIELEISENELKNVLLKVISDEYDRSLTTYGNPHIDRIVGECVREIIYKDKDRIIDSIIERASKECTRKAFKKVLDNFNSD